MRRQIDLSHRDGATAQSIARDEEIVAARCIRSRGGEPQDVRTAARLEKRLSLYLRFARPQFVTVGRSESALFVSARGGKRMTPPAFTAVIAKHSRRIGLKYTMYDLRRAFATHLLAGGAHPAAVKEMLGASGIQAPAQLPATSSARGPECGPPVSPIPMKTLQQHLSDYLVRARTANQSPVHIGGVGFCVRRFLRWLEELHGISSAERLTPQHLEAWVKHYSGRSTRRGLLMKATSISRQFQCDRVFLQWLGKVGVLPQQMYQLIPQVKLPYRLPTGVLSHRQMEKFLGLVETTSPRGLQFRAMLELIYTRRFSAMRSRLRGVRTKCRATQAVRVSASTPATSPVMSTILGTFFSRWLNAISNSGGCQFNAPQLFRHVRRLNGSLVDFEKTFSFPDCNAHSRR